MKTQESTQTSLSHSRSSSKSEHLTKYKICVVLGPVEVLNWEDVHNRGVRHKQTLLKQVDMRLNIIAPPPYSQLIAPSGTVTAGKVQLEVLKFSVLTPDTLRPMLRLSNAFAKAKRLVQIREHLGLQKATGADHWSPRDRELYIHQYAWIRRYDCDGDFALPGESPQGTKNSTAEVSRISRNISTTHPSASAHPDKVREIVTASKTQHPELLDARHVA